MKPYPLGRQRHPGRPTDRAPGGCEDRRVDPLVGDGLAGVRHGGRARHRRFVGLGLCPETVSSTERRMLRLIDRPGVGGAALTVLLPTPTRPRPGRWQSHLARDLSRRWWLGVHKRSFLTHVWSGSRLNTKVLVLGPTRRPGSVTELSNDIYVSRSDVWVGCGTVRRRG